MKNIIKKQRLVFFVVFFVLSGLFFSCSKQEKKKEDTKATKKEGVKLEVNPFFKEFAGKFKLPDFKKIKTKHYMEAFKRGFKEAREGIKAIINNKEKPTFENTIVALEENGKLLKRVSSVFYMLKSADTNDELVDIAKKINPIYGEYRDYIALNDELFAKVEKIYKEKDKLDLSKEEMTMLEDSYRGFIRSGVALSKEDKEKVKKINKEISDLELTFSQNVLKDTNDFKLILKSKEELAGLPQSVIDSAVEAAKRANLAQGEYLFTLHKPSWIPFLQFSERRDLREKLYKGYLNRGNNNNDSDNKKIVARIALLRLKKAKIMGYKNHAAYKLEINMAKNPANAYKLLNKIWVPALAKAKKEAKELQKIINKEKGKFKLASWDWWYYTEKLRKEKYNIDTEELKNYFKLDSVRDGAFYVANKLYGLKFVERKDFPVYHKDVKAFEVLSEDGNSVGVLYTDYFYRPSKRAGAWCGALRGQSHIKGNKIYPVIYNVCNFAPPVGDKPSLVSYDEAKTLFHEFGHALHSLLNNTVYNSTSVTIDFVEMPSQIMEHWCAEPEVLAVYAKHYKTGEVIPKELVDKLVKSKYFNQGFITTEYLAAALLDLKYYTIEKEDDFDVAKFENDYMKKIGLIPSIEPRYKSTYFSHMIGSYDAGYYVYIWSEMLDCDAYEAFKETSLFDKKTAKSFRDNILSKGGSEDEVEMYKAFRGREAKIDGLMKERGFKK